MRTRRALVAIAGASLLWPGYASAAATDITQSPSTHRPGHGARPGSTRPVADLPYREQVLTLPIVGSAKAYVPRSEPKRVALFVSGDGGWTGVVVDTARRMAHDTLVVGLSFPVLRRAVQNAHGCWLPAGDLEVISHAAQKRLQLRTYLAPILIGYSSGATLIYAALAGAPPVTFAGGVSLGFCPDLMSSRPVCHLESWRPVFDVAKRTVWLPPSRDLRRDWYVIQGGGDWLCPIDRTRAFVHQTSHAHLVEIRQAGHGFKYLETWQAQFDAAVSDLWAKAETSEHAPAVTSPSSTDLEGSLGNLNLPLTVSSVKQPSAVLVFLSGDGGWASLDEGIAAALKRNAVSVVGLSSLRYFWSRKTSAQVSEDLRQLVAIAAGQQRPVFIGGYSFGAEVAPVVLQTWSSAERARIAGLVLVAPGRSASFEIEPLDWIRRAPANASTLVAPAVRALNVPTLCLAGSSEDSSSTPCDELSDIKAVRTVKLPGSHHFEGDYGAVGRTVGEFIQSVGTR